MDDQLTLRAFRVEDLEFLDQLDTDPAALGAFEWFGFRDARTRRRRWEKDGFVGSDSTALAVVAADGTTIGIASWKAVHRGGSPGVCLEIGLALLPEYRDQGLGTAAQRLLVDYLSRGQSNGVMPFSRLCGSDASVVTLLGRPRSIPVHHRASAGGRHRCRQRRRAEGTGAHRVSPRRRPARSGLPRWRLARQRDLRIAPRRPTATLRRVGSFASRCNRALQAFAQNEGATRSSSGPSVKSSQPPAQSPRRQHAEDLETSAAGRESTTRSLARRTRSVWLPSMRR